MSDFNNDHPEFTRDEETLIEVFGNASGTYSIFVEDGESPVPDVFFTLTPAIFERFKKAVNEAKP